MAKAQSPTGTARQLTRVQVSKLPPKEKRWALIIGVDKYDDTGITSLRGAANDAKSLSAALRDYAGFPENQIVLLTTDEPKERQPTRVNIMRRLSNLKGMVPSDGLLLVSFSGHGIDRAGQAYLIPSDASVTEDISLLEETALGVERMKNQIRLTGVSQVLILLDACRNDPVGGKADSSNPLTQSYVRGFDFEARNRDIQAFATLYATSIGSRAYEYAEKKQGYFTWAIVNALAGKAANPNTGEVTLRDLIGYVEKTVPQQVAIDLGATKIQKPFAVIEGYRADELVLSVSKAGQAKNVENSLKNNEVAPSAGETAFWDTVKNSNDCDDFKVFLKEYPNSTFAAAARFKISKICKDNNTTQIKQPPTDGGVPAVESVPSESKAKYKEQSEKWLKLLFIDEEYQKVINETSSEIEKNPANSWAYRIRATAYFLTGDEKRVIEDSNNILSLLAAPNKPEDYEIRCFSYFALFKSDEALKDCNKAIELDGKSSFAFMTRGYVYRIKQDFAKSIADFTKAMELEPTFLWLYGERAELNYLKKNFDLAILDYTKAIEAYPKKDSYYVSRAVVYYDKNEADKSVNDLSLVLDRNPLHISVQGEH